MSSPESVTRPRGRPAQLSRAQIVAAALQMLREKPNQSLTMQRLARAMKVAPMSLYSHVRNRDDLLQAIAADVLAGVDLPAVPDEDWRATVRAWARAVRGQFLAHPFLASLLQEGIATPAAWLTLSNPLLQALRQAGLQGEALADAQRWVSRVVVGSVLMELLVPAAVPEEFASVSRALAALPAAQRGLWAEVLPALGQRSDDAVFEYTLDRTLDGLARLRPGGTR